MKRIAAWMLMLALALCLPAFAEATVKPEDERMEPVYTFDLTVNGKHEVAVQPGDVITVVFTITRADEDEDASYTMYSMQNEIEYDDSFVVPMENGCIVRPEIDTEDIALRGNGRAFYMNYLSFVDGSEWNDNQLVGTFQLQVNGESGVTELNNRNFCITKPGAQESYAATCNDLLLYVSDECTIRFETNDGSELENAVANYGELLERPADPVKAGYHLRGWYKDYDLTEEWDFETEPVAKNMVLYAAWDAGNPDKVATNAESTAPAATAEPVQGRRVRVTFDTNRGKPVSDVWVDENQPIEKLPEPVRAGYRFAGWYKDAELREPWSAEDVPTAKKTKLYAAWEKN